MKPSIDALTLQTLMACDKKVFEIATTNAGYIHATILLVKMIFNSLQVVDGEGNFQAVYDSLWINDEYQQDAKDVGDGTRESVYYLETQIFIKFKNGKFYGEFAGVSEPISKTAGDKKFNN
jgi:hypothetical protein